MDAQIKLLADFFTPGVPQPGGSKKAFYIKKLGRAIVTDDNPQAKGWQARVSAFAQDVAPTELWAGSLAVEVEFRMQRPKGHYKADGVTVRPSAPLYPTTRPDSTKLWRSTEDALKGVLFRDDAQIVLQLVGKVFGDDGKLGARIRVYALPERAEQAPAKLRPMQLVAASGSLF